MSTDTHQVEIRDKSHVSRHHNQTCLHVCHGIHRSCPLAGSSDTFPTKFPECYFVFFLPLILTTCRVKWLLQLSSQSVTQSFALYSQGFFPFFCYLHPWVNLLSYQGVTQLSCLFYLVLTRFLFFLLVPSPMGEAKGGECCDPHRPRGDHVCIYYI